MADVLPELLNEIVETARRKGKTQADIVAEAGIGVSSLSRAKSAGDIRLSTLVKLAKTVGLRLTLSPDITIADKIKKGTLFK